MKLSAILVFSLIGGFCSLWAQDPERSFTFDLVHPGEVQSLPTWLAGSPTASPSKHATINFSLVPPADNSDLAITFYFDETIGGFLKVYWAGAQTGEMLCENLFEGIGMPNQRTLLIKRSTLSSAGVLSVQSSESTLNIFRIHWEWVNPQTISAAQQSDEPALIDSVRKVYGNADVSGAPLLSPIDHVGHSVVTATLTDKPERIETGVGFVATLQAVPLYGRLELQITGVPLDRVVSLSVNGSVVSEVSIELPDLSDPGYQKNEGSSPEYIGWRRCTVFLPAKLLKLGDNELQFLLNDPGSSTSVAPVAIKNLVLQLNYDSSLSKTVPSATLQTQAQDDSATKANNDVQAIGYDSLSTPQ